MAKKYDILDANQKIEFWRVFETINDVVGMHYEGWMKACWPNVWGNGKYRLWFPHLAETRNGELVSASFDCVNTISDDWNLVVFDDLKKKQTEGDRKYRGYDLIFAKEPKGGPYLFRGVFVRDDEKSRLNHDVSRRIATKVRLIGDPVFDIELLDEVKDSAKEEDDILKGTIIVSPIKQPKETKGTKAVYTVRKISNPKTAEAKLKNRILREFPKRVLIGDIQIKDDEYEILAKYLRTKYSYMRDSGKRTIIDPVLCVALVQIGIRCYDKAFWPHVKELINDPLFNVNQQNWLGMSFSETLRKYDKIQVSETDRVDSMLMHGFVSDRFAVKFFDFLYAFYKIDLDRDIARLDRNAMNDLISIIERNDNSGRTYFLVEHTADAVRQNKRGAKTRIRRYLKLIDRAFWGDPLPISSSNRLMRLFLDWKDNAAEFVQEKTQHGGSGRKGKKSYSSPYLKYEGKREGFMLVLPPQIIRFQELQDIYWTIESEHFNKIIEINPYAQGVTGYKTDKEECELQTDCLFDSFVINLMDGENRLRTFRITKEIIRFFDIDGDFIRNDALTKGLAYSFTLPEFKPTSEAVLEYYNYGELLRTAYDFVNGDIVRVPDGKPLTVGGRLSEGILPRGIVEGVIAGEFKDNVFVYKDVPSIFVRTQPTRIAGTAIRINDEIFRFASEDGLAKGISEFELMDRTGDKGYIVDLKEFGCQNEGLYSIYIDIPNDRSVRSWKYVYIDGLEYEFEDAPYIFMTRGTLSVPTHFSFTCPEDVQEEISEKKRFNFDIIAGQSRLYLGYKDIDIGFEIPSLEYKFRGENWLIGPHIDIWHGDFDPRLFITYNSDKIRIFLDDTGEDGSEEHTETFYKNKSKGLFDCDLNRFKSWFGREKVSRQVYMDLPGIDAPVPFVKIITQSVFISGLLIADFKSHMLIGEFDIIGYSDYYIDIEFDGELIIEKEKLVDKGLRIDSELRTGIYNVRIYESEENESGFGERLFYEIGHMSTELLNPEDLNGKCIEILRIHPEGDDVSYLPLSAKYQIVDLQNAENDKHIFTGKMIVGGKKYVLATFSVRIEFYDLDRLQKAYITFLEEDEGIEFLYDEYKKVIVKQDDRTIPRSQAYRRFKTSLYPEDFVFDIKFINRPDNANVEVNDENYNNIKIVEIKKKYMEQSIFKK